jgi:hypothetical protein
MTTRTFSSRRFLSGIFSVGAFAVALCTQSLTPSQAIAAKPHFEMACGNISEVGGQWKRPVDLWWESGGSVDSVYVHTYAVNNDQEVISGPYTVERNLHTAPGTSPGPQHQDVLCDPIPSGDTVWTWGVGEADTEWCNNAPVPPTFYCYCYRGRRCCYVVQQPCRTYDAKGPTHFDVNSRAPVKVAGTGNYTVTIELKRNRFTPGGGETAGTTQVDVIFNAYRVKAGPTLEHLPSSSKRYRRILSNGDPTWDLTSLEIPPSSATEPVFVSVFACNNRTCTVVREDIPLP